MKVWEKNGKLIESIDGKVLECDECPCEPPVECCLYSAAGRFSEAYPASDLPSTIVWYDAPGGPLTYNKIPMELAQGLQAYYLAAGSPPIGSGDEDIVGIDESGENWVRWTAGALGGPGQCLINSLPGDDVSGDDFQDEFPDTLTGTYGVFPDCDLERINLCEWHGTQEEGGSTYIYRVRYNPDGTSYKWTVQIENEGGIIGEWVKDDPQSSPEGDYDGIFTVAP